MFLSLWNRFVTTFSRTPRSSQRGRGGPVGRPFRRPLWLEPLEDRLVFATSAFYSMPINLTGNQGTVVSVPVSINHLFDAAGNQGLNAADVILTYDPTVFSVANADVTAGSLLTNAPPNGTWTFTQNTATLGEIDITLFSSDLAHDVTSSTGGVVANVNFHVKGSAATGNSTIHVVVPAEMSPNGLNSDATPDSGPNSIQNDATGYTLDPTDQVDGVINVTNITPVTTLSAPTTGAGNPGNTITVPVNISNPDPNGSSGMFSADAAILYDPNLLSVAATGAVNAGSAIPATGWTVTYGVDTSGNNTVDPTKASVGLHLVNTNNTPLTSTAPGSLWMVTFTINSAAAGGTTAVNLVPSAKVGGSITTTNVTGLNKVYQLSPAPTNAANDTVDGLITINQAAAITSGNTTTFTTGVNGSFTVTTTGSPKPSLSESGSLPTGVSFTDNGNGTATLGGMPASGMGGTFPFTITAHNGVGTDATQNFTLTVNQPAAITSSNSTTFTVGSTGSFSVTATGFPTPSLSESGSLPTGVGFTDNGNGTATLTGMPAAGMGGTYPITIIAHNAVGSDATQNFTLTVDQAAAITSGNSTTFTVGTNGSFSVTTTGFPKPALSEIGALPTGVGFTDNGDGTATLQGMPAAGMGGTYPFTITAHNGIGSNATQNFTLTVNQAAVIDSANSTTFTTGVAGSFTVTTDNSFPHPSLSESGPLPTGVSFTDNGNGTATLHGMPAAGTGGTFPVTITAHNGIGSDATQNFTLTVNQAAAITSGNSTTFTVGANGSFSVTTTGFPKPSLSESGALPTGVGFTDNGNGTATLTGMPAAGMGGTYPITITAHNGIGSDATQNFTLTVNETAAITSGNSTTFTVGTNGSFSVTTTGFPKPSLSESGALPTGVSFTDNGNGTATLHGLPAANMGGTYPITITAHNGVGTDATQNFTLTVDQAAAITSGNSTTFTVGTNGSFSVTTTGFPTPTLSETGALPTGVGFTDNGNGTATLTGMPAAGMGGTYPITITARNGIGSDATQNFTLTVNEAAAITSGNSTTFTVGTNGSFSVTTTGFPKPSLSESGALPTGVSFTDNGNGTATLHGMPAAGTGNTYPFTITAHNGIGSDATQSFTLTVNQAAAITSGNSTTFTVGANGSFSVMATGFPKPSLNESGPLPTGVSFTDNGNGTATLHGLPAAGTGGLYPFTITAHNGVGSDATQSFTLTVNTVHFAISVPTGVFTGKAFNFTVTALDSSNNNVTNYSGTVHFTSSDGAATLPANAVLTNGSGTFSATLATLGNQTLTATDTVNTSISGTSPTITVSMPLPANHFAISVPTGVLTGNAFNFTITALDSSNSTVTGYSGTVHFTSSDGAATLPANAVLTNGSGTFSATLATLGNQTLTATDTVTASISGTSPAIAVTSSSVAKGTFISQVYLDLLQRQPDPQGLAYWTAQLNGGVSQTEMAFDLTQSPEYLVLEVEGLYLSLLRRPVDASGFAWGISLLVTGTTTEQLKANIIGSPEYFATQGGGTTAGFLNALYRDVLGRPIDPTGQAWANDQLQTSSNADVAYQVLTSMEAQTDLVEQAYQQYLGRQSDPNGLAYYIGLLQQGITDQSIYAQLIGSPEFLQTQTNGQVT